MRARRPRRPARGGTPALDIVYEDQDLLVVNKPERLLTVATAGEKQRTLWARAFEVLAGRRPPERPFVVHRLDRDASGLLILAKSERTQRALQRQFATREAGRVYLAVVEGRLEPEEQTIRSFLRETRALKVHSARDPREGRLAVSHVRVLRAATRFSLVEVRLETGRKHQIRAHLAEAGHPIVGDRRYGSAGPLGRLALHAEGLTFEHPRSGKTLCFRSAPPRAFGALVRAAAPATRANAALAGPRGMCKTERFSGKRTR